MIFKSIHLENFQKHKDLFLELGKTTVIQGESDRGKSSIIRGIYWVCFNRPSGMDFRTTGTEEVKVTITTVKGDTVTRGKSQKESYYILNGEKFTGFGKNVPEPVQRVLPITQLNIARQHEDMFLLSGSRPEASRYIFSLIGLDEMDKSLSIVEGRRRNKNGSIVFLESELEEKKDSYKTYKQVPEMKKRVQILENMDNTINRLKDDSISLSEIIRVIRDLDKRKVNIKKIDELLSLIKEIRQSTDSVQHLSTLLGKAKHIHIKYTSEHIETAENRLLSLESMQGNINTLLNKINRFRAFFERIEECEESIEIARSNLQKTETEWKKRMKGKCPICGQNLSKKTQ